MALISFATQELAGFLQFWDIIELEMISCILLVER